MSSLIGIIVKVALPYVVAAGFGFGVAWWVQGLNVAAAKNDRDKIANQYGNYKVEQQRLKNEAEAKAEQRRKETADEWARKYEQLEKDGNAFRRCVAAGKCGGLRVVPACPGGPGLRLPAAGGADGGGGSAVPPPGEPAAQDEQDEPEVIRDCAKVQLRLNELQADIERQEGYFSKRGE